MLIFRPILLVLMSVFVVMGFSISNVRASELFGKSMIRSYTYQIIKCVKKRCKIHRDKRKAEDKLYFSKDGKKIFSYTKKDAGVVHLLNKPKLISKSVLALTIMGNSFVNTIKHTTNGNKGTTISEVHGDKCSLIEKFESPVAKFKYKYFGPVTCLVYEGNIFN
jgi:hypothetical protein